ncbi:MAG: hypothetical protein Q9217_005552 [Psora testacea]
MKRRRPQPSITHAAVKELGSKMNSNSVPRNSRKKLAQSPQKPIPLNFSTPCGINTRSPYTASSSDFLARQTPSVHNIRQALAENRMWFRNDEALERCPEFKQKFNQHFHKERSSNMKKASYKKIVRHMTENATSNEDSYYDKLVDYVIKDARCVGTKRNAVDEIVTISKSFVEDGIERKKGVKLAKGFLPGQMDKLEKKLGLTDSKPDYIFGIKENRFPDPCSTPSDTIKAIIGIASGIVHPFFVIEDKGAEGSLEKAQNQAIRDGATIVNARMRLKMFAVPKGYVQPVGADPDAIAFSCAWITDRAELYIHWYEKRSLNDPGIFHMNRLGNYMLDREGELASFRHDIHNILDWGALNHKKTIEAVVDSIVAKERGATRATSITKS